MAQHCVFRKCNPIYKPYIPRRSEINQCGSLNSTNLINSHGTYVSNMIMESDQLPQCVEGKRNVVQALATNNHSGGFVPWVFWTLTAYYASKKVSGTGKRISVKPIAPTGCPWYDKVPKMPKVRYFDLIRPGAKVITPTEPTLYGHVMRVQMEQFVRLRFQMNTRIYIIVLNIRTKIRIRSTLLAQ